MRLMMIDRPDLPIPMDLLRMAHALASAHGHAWTESVHLPPAGDFRAPDMTGLDIAAATVTDCPTGWPDAGITMPILSTDYYGPTSQYWYDPRFGGRIEIRHRSATGRVGWTITRWGGTTIEIYRASGEPCLSGWVSPHGEVTAQAKAAPASHRHVTALRRCLAALATADAASTALAALPATVAD